MSVRPRVVITALPIARRARAGIFLLVDPFAVASLPAAPFAAFPSPVPAFDLALNNRKRKS